MNKLFFGLFMAAFALNAHAQTEGFIFEGDLSIKTTGAFLKLQGENITDVKNFLEQKGVKGSPYLMDEFVDGFVVTNTNIKYINVPLRYNLFNEEIEFRKDESVLALQNPNDYRAVSIGNQLFIYSSYLSSTTIRSGYFEVLNNQKNLLLLKRYGVELLDPIPTRGYVEAKPAEFKKLLARYYLRFDESPAQEITNQKAFISMFGEKRQFILDLIDKEQLKFKKEADLVRIVQYYNSIL
ncbi:MAG TPA: hypothetical protein DCG69_02470 [Bacteroidales bacterium]|nr:hypothetical protein [Bacteroidales bacterium]